MATDPTRSRGSIDTPRATGIIVIGALVALAIMRRTFSGVSIQVGS